MLLKFSAQEWGMLLNLCTAQCTRVRYATEVQCTRVRYATEVQCTRVRYATEVQCTRVRYATEVQCTRVRYATEVQCTRVGYATERKLSPQALGIHTCTVGIKKKFPSPVRTTGRVIPFHSRSVPV